MAETTIPVTGGSGHNIGAWDRTISSVVVKHQFMLPGEYPYHTYLVQATGVSVATADAHLVQIMSSASTSLRIRRIRLWIASTAAANTLAIDLFRLSSAGTGGTALTPAPVDLGDGASAWTAMTLPSSKGTESTFLGRMRIPVQSAHPLNPNGPAVLYDQRPDEKPIIVPTGAASGLALKVSGNVASTTVDFQIDVVDTAWLGNT